MKNNLLRKESLQIVVLALPFVLAAVLWDKLPARVVTHWNLHNQPNGSMPKAVGLLVPPAINVLVTGLFALAPRLAQYLRPDRSGTTPSLRRTWRVARLGLSTFIAAISLMVITEAAGWQMNVGWVCGSGILILLAVVGNSLANLEPNYLMGIRTPWTLGDPATWRATHRMGSRVMVFGSLALLLTGIFMPAPILLSLIIGFAILLALGSLGYSAWFYRRHTVRSINR